MSLTIRQRNHLVQAAEPKANRGDRVVFWGAVALLILLGVFL